MSGLFSQLLRNFGRRPASWQELHLQVAKALFELDFPGWDWNESAGSTLRRACLVRAERALETLLRCNVDLPRQRQATD